MYHRTSLAPGDVSAWSAEQTVPGNTGTQWASTYPNPMRLALERPTYLFWRGGNFNPAVAAQADGAETWSTPRNLITVANERPYAKYESDGQATIHVAFTNAHPREADDVNKRGRRPRTSAASTMGATPAASSSARRGH